ncbi:MAG: pyridoxal phosphate-dependent aminotransferase [Planctomycetes bacterium]|nr:pyridoxal phosphate-dependent aminotransferase [Planctomycetota bacterium]MCB9917014.1 pyridoxal phosphate-dependent aminotransferase [Planctomycetota bacterium]
MKLARRMQNLGTETAFEVLARAKALEAEGRSIIHLQIGEPDFDTPKNVIEAGCNALRSGFTHYGPSPGLPALRAAIAEDVGRSRGVHVAPEEVVVVPGGKPILFFVMLALLESGTSAIYPNPGFPIYESMIRFLDAKAVPLPLREENDFALDVDELAGLLDDSTRLLVLNSPSNPCGGVLPSEDVDKLADVLRKYPDLWILTDEIYSRILYDGMKHDSLLRHEDLRHRIVLLDGFSKTYAMTGWRLGYGVMPKEFAVHVARLQTNATSCTASATQIAGIEALTGPQDDVDTMLRAFDHRRHVIVDGLNALPGVTCRLPKGAFYAFANFSSFGKKSKELETLFLEQAGVACLTGTSFGKYGEGYLRFSYANSVENIEEGLRRIRDCIENVLS